jgi:hypothetical protein
MSGIEPPEPERESSPWRMAAIVALKILGTLLLAVLILGGIILGTCLYAFRDMR